MFPYISAKAHFNFAILASHEIPVSARIHFSPVVYNIDFFHSWRKKT